MEVKHIFAHLMMRSYERHDEQNTHPAAGGSRKEAQQSSDTITISETAGRRFFREVVENSLQKGLSEVSINENS
ncbi:MAG TPA: hypothetical protein PLW83_07005 [Deltaproteobacteria bacterium]|nr:hypothetical protein [Deltaproteobacteria bacterium]